MAHFTIPVASDVNEREFPAPLRWITIWRFALNATIAHQIENIHPESPNVKVMRALQGTSRTRVHYLEAKDGREISDPWEFDKETKTVMAVITSLLMDQARFLKGNDFQPNYKLAMDTTQYALAQCGRQPARS